MKKTLSVLAMAFMAVNANAEIADDITPVVFVAEVPPVCNIAKAPDAELDAEVDAKFKIETNYNNSTFNVTLQSVTDSSGNKVGLTGSDIDIIAEGFDPETGEIDADTTELSFGIDWNVALEAAKDAGKGTELVSDDVGRGEIAELTRFSTVILVQKVFDTF